MAVCSLSSSSADFAVIYEQYVEAGRGCVSSITYVTSPQALEIAVSGLLGFPVLESLKSSTGLRQLGSGMSSEPMPAASTLCNRDSQKGTDMKNERLQSFYLSDVIRVALKIYVLECKKAFRFFR